MKEQNTYHTSSSSSIMLRERDSIVTQRSKIQSTYLRRVFNYPRNFYHRHYDNCPRRLAIGSRESLYIEVACAEISPIPFTEDLAYALPILCRFVSDEEYSLPERER